MSFNCAFTFCFAVLLLVTACAPSTPVIVPTNPNPLDEKVDIGGYALRILCTGQGTPTVIIEAGFGEPAVEKETSSWTTVINGIEETTRICVYDRAGLGSSDVAPGKNRTSKDIVRDLHTLLVNAHVPGPYILVGHSLGGYHILLFANKYPKDVVGMVLVDSSHPDQWSEVSAVLPPESPNEPDSLKRLRRIPPASLPEKLDIPASARQVRAVKSLGDLPLVVLTHNPVGNVFPDLSQEVAEKIEQVWQKLQNELASLSSNSSHIISAKSGHYIQVDEPQLVIDAILKVIAEVKK